LEIQKAPMNRFYSEN